MSFRCNRTMQPRTRPASESQADAIADFEYLRHRSLLLSLERAQPSPEDRSRSAREFRRAAGDRDNETSERRSPGRNREIDKTFGDDLQEIQAHDARHLPGRGGIHAERKHRAP